MFDLNDQCGWFALYKTNLENKFYIEGYNSKLIFKEAYLNKEEIIKDTYSLFFDYSYDDYKYANLCFSNSYYHRDCPFIFYDKEIVSSIFFF